MKARIFLIWLGLFLGVFFWMVPAGATDELPALICLKIETSSNSPHPEVTGESLRRTIFVGLKAKLPRLLLAEDCANQLAVFVNLVDLSANRLDAWYGLLIFEVRRPATVNETGEILNANVWSPGYLLFHGSKDTISRQVTRKLTEFIEKLAEDYYLSGN